MCEGLQTSETMTEAERDRLLSYMNKARNYLEFGAGKSTVIASEATSVQHIDSVDSSIDFVQSRLMKEETVREAVQSGRLDFHLIDLGEVTDWGIPVDRDKKHLWPNYSLKVFSERSEHDLVLVDGRFRVACALNCVLNTPDSCIILIHDFWDRPKYHRLLDFLEVQDQVDTMGVFTKKKDYDAKKLHHVINLYQYLPNDDLPSITNMFEDTLGTLSYMFKQRARNLWSKYGRNQ